MKNKFRSKFPLPLRHDIETGNIQPVDWSMVDRCTRGANNWPMSIHSRTIAEHLAKLEKEGEK